MNVEQLRRVLAELPGEMPVVLSDSKLGWMENAALYVAPAHLDRRTSGTYVYARHHDGGDNCHALLVSGFGQPDEGVVDISPRLAWPTVIDVEPERCAAQPIHRRDIAATKYTAGQCNKEPDCVRENARSQPGLELGG